MKYTRYLYANDGQGYLVENMEEVFDVIEKYVGSDFVSGMNYFSEDAYVSASDYDELLEYSTKADKKVDELTAENERMESEIDDLKERIVELEAELKGVDNYPIEFFDRDGNLRQEFADETCIEMPVKKVRKPRKKAA